MIIASLLFYLFAAVLVISALCVISARNPVHAVLWLILAFFNAAGLFVLMGAELIAMMLVIVYVGAVAVLFLFVVMMLNIKFTQLREGFLRYAPVLAVLAVALFAQLFLMLHYAGAVNVGGAPNATASSGVTNAQAIGHVLYTQYMLPFQASGLILLVAMVGAIVLTHRQREGVRRQKIAQQMARDPKKTIEVVKVKIGQGIS